MEHEQIRHVVIEKPDGSVAVGTNHDIEAPPIVEPASPTDTPNITYQVEVKYAGVLTHVYYYIYVPLGMVGFIARFSVIDILNVVFLCCTLYFIMSNRFEGRAFLVIHSMVSCILVMITCILYYWIDAIYFFCLGVHLLLISSTSEVEIIRNPT